MIPLDRYEKWSACLDDDAGQFLNEAEYQAYRSIAAPEKLRQLKAILEKPIAEFTLVNEVFSGRAGRRCLPSPNRVMT